MHKLLGKAKAPVAAQKRRRWEARESQLKRRRVGFR